MTTFDRRSWWIVGSILFILFAIAGLAVQGAIMQSHPKPFVCTTHIVVTPDGQRVCYPVGRAEVPNPGY